MLYKSNSWKLEWEAIGPLEFTWRFKYLMCDVVVFVSVHAISIRFSARFFWNTCILIISNLWGEISKKYASTRNHTSDQPVILWTTRNDNSQLFDIKILPASKIHPHSTYWRFRLLVLVAVTNINHICIYLNLCVCIYVSCLNNILDMYTYTQYNNNIIYMHYS